MENAKKSWKFQLLPPGTPKQIALRGLIIFLFARVVSFFFNVSQVNIFGAAPDVAIIKIAIILSGYGALMIFVAFFKYIVLKYKTKEATPRDINSRPLASLAMQHTPKIQAKILFVVIFLVSFLFYWYEYRPLSIRKSCHAVSKELNLSAFGLEAAEKEYNAKYIDCLRSYGF